MAKKTVDYGALYDELYKYGYHAKEKNHGQKYTFDIVMGYRFQSILEIGCSNGIATKHFQRANKRAFGIDISTIAIRYAQEKFGTINCCVASATDIPFKDKYFDAVFTCDVLEHLVEDDALKAIKEIDRVVKSLIFIKVSDRLEGNHEFTKKMHSSGKFQDISNLHLTVKSIDWWIAQFKRYGWKKKEKNVEDLFVFYR